ncbi:dihydrodipicolinate reductase [Cognatishimia sp. F0-27]|uniref:dihydrodipicolinate reductase n=1 Tax=Cognatishimia sp. F0-27 TaxID=2816855 RepID=UPI001D0C1313|nr:dihydrodipicolinate reductase [Cognatishimia sp. F0-27]MCC1492208.1 dihydrodipicolinate reductase [Cognatishimia sp. F0-27]
MTNALGMIVAAACLGLATAAQADFAKVDDKSAFLSLVQGKTLKRPFVTLQVTPDGGIAGRGARWDVTGNWQWQNGFFCRDLYWGGDDLGYNCQEVRADGNRIRFTSDRGAGRSADFRLQ